MDGRARQHAEEHQFQNCSPKEIEKELISLGSAYSDLDTAYEADQFQELRALLKDIEGDYRAGGERFRLLFPDSNSPQIASPTPSLLCGSTGNSEAA
jgi:hypothetical protein